MEIEEKKFGELNNGEEVIEYILTNQQLQINILNYGGIIRKIYAPDQQGKQENIVLGFDNVEDYQNKSPYYGAIIGRHAGRIANAEFEINDQSYKLSKNESNNNLHGGLVGLDQRIWEVKKIESGLELNYFSPHLEEGFPANVEFRVRYLLIDNQLKIEYSAKPDRETIINLTNHSYFNLTGGAKTDILNHQLQLKAQKILALAKDSIPTGELINVQGTPFDFREFKKIGADIEADYQQLQFTGGYDHPFVLEERDDCAILKEENSGRILTISTDQPAIVFYDGNQLKNDRLGLCLETQDYPNAINLDGLAAKTYTPDNIYTAKTSYKFATV
ncbi:MAG: aldose epimerase family protein [Bacillota bacterium]